MPAPARPEPGAAAPAARSADEPVRWRTAVSERLLLVAALLLVVVTPFFRGLFFPLEQLVALLVALGLFTVHWLTRPRRDVVLTPLDVAVLALVAAYAVSTAFAAAPRAAVQDVVKNLLYAVTFWLVHDLARGERERLAVLHALMLAALGVAVLGLGAAAGTINYKAAWEGGRISSSLQYPNTLAAYLTAGFFVTLGLWSRAAASRPLLGFLYLPVAALLFFVFIYTQSRGAWLLFPAVAAVFWLASPGGSRMAAGCGLVAAVAAAAPGVVLFPQALASGRPGPVWMAGLLAVPLALALHAVVAGLLRLGPRLRAAVLAVLAVGAMAGASLALREVVAPQVLVQRLQSIRASDYSGRSRIEWTYDALRVAMDRPVTGWGGGGWNAVYLGYQRWPYWTTQVHNHFAQTLVEVGLVGFAVFLALWAAWLSAWWRAWRGPRPGPAGPEGPGRVHPESRALAGVLAAGLALGAHSFLDFNLSLSAVALYLWTLFAVTRAAERDRAGELPLAGARLGPARRRGRRGGPAWAVRWVPAGVAVLAMLLSASLALGIRAGRAAAAALRSGDVAAAREGFGRAARLDPLEPSYRMDLGSALEALAGREPNAARKRDLLRQAADALAGGVRLEQRNPNYRTLLGLFLLRHGQIEAGLRELEEARRLHPHEIRRYETLARAYSAAAQQLLVKNPDQARAYLRQALAQAEEAARVRAGEPAWVPEGYRMPQPTPALLLAVGQAQALSGDLAAAEASLAKAAGSAEVQAEARAWLAAVQAEAGKAEAARQTEAAGAAAGRAFQDHYDRARLYLAVALHPEGKSGR